MHRDHSKVFQNDGNVQLLRAKRADMLEGNKK